MNKQVLTAIIAAWIALTAIAQGQPNIIYILADDWGLGDVKAYGGDRCKIDTPHMDRLAARGMKFTDAHSSSSVCTPSRYSILTGRYNWRTRLKSGVLYGFSSALIEPGRATVASMLQHNGYATSIIGKWHLGMDFASTDGGKISKNGSNVNWRGQIENGPLSVGFDYFWGIAASLDMPPYIWIENDRFVGECTTLKKHFGRGGPAHADFEAVDVLPMLTQKAVAYVSEQAQTKQPFFLYMPLNSPHTPIVPSAAFQGKSALGAYGDFVMETDWSIGEVVKAVEQAGIADNTLIIVTADNGCSPRALDGVNTEGQIQFRMETKVTEDPNAHYPSDIYRGYKADIYEGGHRVPFIARWDGTVQAGSVSDAPVCLVDLFATCAAIVDAPVAETAAEDSVSLLPLLLGSANARARATVVHHSIRGSFAIRQGKWKLAFCPGSGGWSHPKPAGRKKQKGKRAKKGSAQVDAPIVAKHQSVQLFDMQADPYELNNLAGQFPEIVKQLSQLAEKQIADGRSTPGTKQPNDGTEIELYPAPLKK